MPRPPPPAGQKQEGAGGGLMCVALGAGADPQWVFALDVSARPKEEVEAQAAAGDGAARVVFEPVRGLMATMVQAEIAVCGQGGALLAWHRLNHVGRGQCVLGPHAHPTAWPPYLPPPAPPSTTTNSTAEYAGAR